MHDHVGDKKTKKVEGHFGTGMEANYMNLVKTFLAILLGFLVGFAVYRPKPARAAGNVYVQQVSVGVYNPIRGSSVVGFSCSGSGASAACFIASQ